MKKQRLRNNQPSTRPNSASGEGWAFVNEPDDPSCNPKAKWCVRYRHVELSGQFEIEIRFRTRSGTRDTIIDLRTGPRPNSRKFVVNSVLGMRGFLRIARPARSLLNPVRATPREAMRSFPSPVFVMVRQASSCQRGCTVRRTDALSGTTILPIPSLAEIRGEFAQYSEGVLIPALCFAVPEFRDPSRRLPRLSPAMSSRGMERKASVRKGQSFISPRTAASARPCAPALHNLCSDRQTS